MTERKKPNSLTNFGKPWESRRLTKNRKGVGGVLDRPAGSNRYEVRVSGGGGAGKAVWRAKKNRELPPTKSVWLGRDKVGG